MILLCAFRHRAFVCRVVARIRGHESPASTANTICSHSTRETAMEANSSKAEPGTRCAGRKPRLFIDGRKVFERSSCFLGILSWKVPYATLALKSTMLGRSPNTLRYSPNPPTPSGPGKFCSRPIGEVRSAANSTYIFSNRMPCKPDR